MRRLFVIAVLFLWIASAFADDRKDRANEEWQKFEDRGTNVCFGTGGLYLSYTPLDRKQFYAVQFSPYLKPDLLKRAAPLLQFKEDSAKQLVENEMNAALNQHIEELRNGTYNRIEINLGKGNSFTITPGNSDTEPVLVWLPSHGMRRLAAAIDAASTGTSTIDSVYILNPDGKFEPLGNNAPAWLESKDLLKATSARNRGAEQRRQAHFTECK